MESIKDMASGLGAERRHYSRVLYDAETLLTRQDQIVHAELVDISLRGALIKLIEPFPIARGDRFSLKVLLVDGHAIQMEVECRHVDGDRYGLHCHYIDLDSICRLKRLVELNLGNPAQIERELQDLLGEMGNP